MVKGSRGHGFLQGYNAQAVTNEHQIVIAAEVMTVDPDFGHLEPMSTPPRAGSPPPASWESRKVSSRDAGYWHQQQMERIVDRGIPVLIPPDSSRRKGTRPGWDGGAYAFMRRVLATDRGGELYGQRQNDDRAGLRRHQVQPRHRPLPTPRPSRPPRRWRLITATHNLLKLHRHAASGRLSRPGRSQPAAPAETHPLRRIVLGDSARAQTYATASANAELESGDGRCRPPH